MIARPRSNNMNMIDADGWSLAIGALPHPGAVRLGASVGGAARDDVFELLWAAVPRSGLTPERRAPC